MFKQTFLCLFSVLVGYIGGMQAIGHSQESGLRIEALGGKCQYRNGQDGQWRKDNYATDLSLITSCASLGVSQTLWPTLAGNLGYRVAYVDFGLASASTYVPARDDEANTYPSGQFCDQTDFSGCVGKYDQWGRAKGITLGALLEQPTKYGTFGIEGGGFVYDSYWRVHGTVPGPGTCSSCGTPAEFDWNGAKGTHGTWYAGLTYAARLPFSEALRFFAQVRYYKAVYASQSSKTGSALDIGLPGGPFRSVMFGLQLEL